MPGIGAIILAAGGSTRMGSAKQLLSFAGNNFLHRAVAAATESGCDPVVVCLGYQAERMEKELAGLAVHIAINPAWEKGIGSTIRAGVGRLIELAPTVSAALILLCDQPLITSGIVRRLVAARHETGKGVCVCSFDDTVGPPVLVAAEYFPALLGLSDQQGAKSIWLAHPEDVCKMPCPEAAADVDSPDDYDRLIE